MKIIQDYIECKKEHLKFFRLTSDLRLKRKNEFFTIKAKVDKFENQIINSILNYSLDLDNCLLELKDQNFDGFLNENEEIKKFKKQRELNELYNYDEISELEKLIEFEKLCKKVWDDFIITEEERKELDLFCKENNIDEVQQKDIETDVISKLNHQIDIKKTIKYYFIEEKRKTHEISWILEHEYFIQIRKEKLESFINEISSENREENENIYKGTLIKKIKLHGDIIHVVGIENETKYEFDISYFDSNHYNEDHYKVLINNELIDESSDDRIIGIITDAHLYKSFNTKQVNAFSKFLQLKKTVREQITRAYY